MTGVDVQWTATNILCLYHTRFRRQLVQVFLNIEPLLQKIPDTWRRWFKMVKMNMTILVHTPDDVIYPELIVYKNDMVGLHMVVHHHTYS